jgi:hypothetical protein
VQEPRVDDRPDDDPRFGGGAGPGVARALQRPERWVAPEIAHTSVAASGAHRNEDAFLVRREPPALVAIADGAGRAEGAARRALDLLQRLVAESVAGGPTTPVVAPGELPPPPDAIPVVPPPALAVPDHPFDHVSLPPVAEAPDLDSPDHELALFPAWRRWLALADSALLGGAESTLLAVALLPGRLVGAYAGGDRAVLLRRDGGRELLTAEPGGPRLGSGRCQPRPIHVPVAAGDVVLLATDGLWKALSLERMERLVRATPPKRFAELPARLVEEASRTGRDDDMTVVAVRVPATPRPRPAAERRARLASAGVHDQMWDALLLAFKHGLHELPWLVEEPGRRRLTWYSPRTRTQVVVEPPRRKIEGVEVVARCETVLAVRVRAEALALRGLPLVAPSPDLSALVYDPTWHRCSLVTKVYSNARDVKLWARECRTALLLQAMRAARSMDRLIHHLDAQAPSYRHPHWGRRPLGELILGAGAPDEPRGERPWSRSDLDWLLAETTMRPAEVREIGPDEVGFRLVGGELRLAVGTFEEDLGHGLRIALVLDREGDPAMMAQRAMELNRAEARGQTGFALLGGWTVEQGRLAFVSFLPELAYQRSLGLIVIKTSSFRAWWAKGFARGWA